nr:NS7b protein [Hipposideros bat coronavirus]
MVFFLLFITLVGAAPTTYRGSDIFLSPSATTSSCSPTTASLSYYTVLGPCLTTPNQLTSTLHLVDHRWVLKPQNPTQIVAIPYKVVIEQHFMVHHNDYGYYQNVLEICMNGFHIPQSIAPYRLQ